MKQKKGPPSQTLSGLQIKENTDKPISNVDFYNKHIRKEGEPVLTQEEYNQMSTLIVKIDATRKQETNT